MGPTTKFSSLERDEAEISPSTLYAIACVLENIPFINGSPQNTFVPGGDDFKSGQTKEKKILVHGRIASWILQHKLRGLLMMPVHFYWQKTGQGDLTFFPILINTEVDGTLLINITGHYVERGLRRE